MTIEIFLVLGVAVIAMGLFMTELLRMDIVALLVLASLALLGLVSPQNIFSGFSNQATITVAAMFILAAGLQNTGALSAIGTLLDMCRSPTTFLLMLFGLLAVIAPFVNNTAVVAVFMPIVMTSCLKIGMSPTKALIPLSYIAQATGVCTLIGTSTNLIVNSVAQELGYPGFSMFEFLPLGAVCVVAGWIYLLTVGRYLLPEKSSADVETFPELGVYDVELHVAEKSRLLDKSVETARVSEEYQVYVRDLWRDGEKLSSPRSEVLQAGDIMLVRGKWANLQMLKEGQRLEFESEDEGPAEAEHERSEQSESEAKVLVELMIAPNSTAIGHRLQVLGRGLSSQTRILGIQRRGAVIRDQLDDAILNVGDMLLLLMPETFLSTIRGNKNFIILSEREPPFPKDWRAPFSLLVMALVVMLPALGMLPIAVASVIGAVAMVLARCLSADTMYEAIDWRIIVLMAGMLPFGAAMSDSGAAQFIVEHTVGLVHAAGPHIVLAVLYLMALLLGEMMSNSAAAVLLTPIGISTGQLMGTDATPFLIAITFSASTSFLTPVGYQTNTMVYTAGGYRFTDFIKVGLPLNLIFWVLGVLLIPIFWPFYSV